jgi:hypothetical protein
MGLTFLAAASVSYFGGFVPSDDPVTKLAASLAVSATATLGGYGIRACGQLI